MQPTKKELSIDTGVNPPSEISRRKSMPELKASLKTLISSARSRRENVMNQVKKDEDDRLSVISSTSNISSI